MTPLEIIVPMAGAGSRFAVAGYKQPKPLIPVHGVPMLRLVIENLRPGRPHRFTFICQRAHEATYGLEAMLSAWAPGCNVVLLDGLTEGAACTVLMARGVIDPEAELMIANSDQYVAIDIDDYLDVQRREGLDGLIMTMKANDPKWSFVSTSGGLVTSVVEKQVISDDATVGIYNFRRSNDFLESADRMIAEGLRINNEFYVAPVYNQLIARGARIGIYNVGMEGDGMYGLGIPADLMAFEQMELSKKVTCGLR